MAYEEGIRWLGELDLMLERVPAAPFGLGRTVFDGKEPQP